MTTGAQGGGSRRELFRGCARYAVLAGLAILGGALAGRRGERCAGASACGGCGRFDYCALPRAWEIRRLSARRKKLARSAPDGNSND